MQSIFIAPFNMQEREPYIPPFESDEDGIQLYFTNDSGELEGGFCCMSYVPNDLVIVKVTAPESTITAMKANEKYLWLEDIEEVEDVI